MNTKIEKTLFLISGTIFYSLYVTLLLTPSKIGTGGILGICLCLNKLFDFKIGLTTILLNIPLFLFGFSLLGKKFAFKSALIVFISSSLIDYIKYIFPDLSLVPVNDKLTASILCGVVSGLGMSLIFMGGGSTGGLDISAKIIKDKFKNIQLSHILLLQDSLVYIFVAMVMGPQSVIYALIMSFIRSKTIDTVQEGIASSRQCIIICNNPQTIIHEINTKLNRGATLLSAEGGFSHEKRNFIYVIIQKHELHELRLIVRNLEPTAFVTVSPVNDIMGNYHTDNLSM